MNKRVIKQLYRKEILDVIRDKKTVIMMLVVPLIIYPLMFVLGLQFMTKFAVSMEEKTYVVALDFAEEGGRLAQIFTENEGEGWKFEVKVAKDLEQAIREEAVDVGVSMRMEGGRPAFTITYVSSITNSAYAVDKVEEALSLYARELTEGSLRDAGLDAEQVLNPIEISYCNLASNEESTGSLLGMIIPFMLVISLLMGTMYPAIDTTAGERERGTLETLLTLPITNQELITGKFLTVATIGIVSALLNLLSMGGLGVYLYGMMKESLGMEEAVKLSSFVPALAICVLCVLAFAVLLSALSMCCCAFAKTYKEANNYITPLMLVVMFASFVGFMPNVRLTQGMALFPVANICLLLRDILAFKFSFRMIVLVLLSNVAYGIFAVLLLGKLYNSETILFGDSAFGSQIFERRSNMKRGGVPAKGDVLFVLALVLMLMFYAGSFATVRNVHVGLLVTQLLVGGVPLIVALYTKKDVKKTFRIRTCSPLYFVAGLFLILGALLLGMILTAVSSTIFRETGQALSQNMQQIMNISFPAALLLTAALPAICEELLFRGYLFTTLEHNMKPRRALLLAAVLFGAYHMNLVQSLTTVLLGFVICYVSYKSKSIFPGMLMHFVNNAIACVAQFYTREWNRVYYRILASLPSFLVWHREITAILLGFLLIAVGVFIVRMAEKKSPKNI